MKPSRPRLLLLVTLLLVASCDLVDNNDSSTPIENLKDLKGRWLVINYWAEWCKPCIEEIPELNNFAQHYSEDVRVFGVNFDGLRGDKLSAASKKLGIAFPTLTDDPATLLGYERPSVLPTTIVINPEGELQHTLLGPQTADSLSKAISP